ncbi:MAG: hypothetical protein GOMPHAMPRED_002827 [Gomphillus americanus]|uniref:Uncharacterized protein n=1 Tax=Gomphillus americanus TaxID=1940652 RepID=A0A8H3IRK0_9LECA|nr:MAG: hypothetical protein GOMPHAMPRED_002827 [Gomphillus americanus]
MTAKGPLGSRLLDSGLPSMSKDENKSKSTLELLDNTPSAIQDTYICRRQKLAADAQAVRHASKDFSEAEYEEDGGYERDDGEDEEQDGKNEKI